MPPLKPAGSRPAAGRRLLRWKRSRSPPGACGPTDRPGSGRGTRRSGL